MTVTVKHTLITALIFLAVVTTNTASAQNASGNTIPHYKIGIFAPLYLDSIFSNNNFRYSKGIPRFIIPAADFVQGAMVALDSMPHPDAHIDVIVYDSKSYNTGLTTLIKNKKLDSLNLMIGNVKDAEYKQLADFALLKKIPFISATYPNDGGITQNPYLVIVNSTLKAHCEAIYSYILQNHGTDKIILCRQPGIQEDMVASFFKQSNDQDGQPLLQIETLNFDSAHGEIFLKTKLDSNRQTLIIGASLDENFATKLVAACSNLNSTYPIMLVGMPNWDGFTGLQKKNDKNEFSVYFTSPYFNDKTDDYSKMVLNLYAKKYKGKPSDMAFKGFEMTWLFSQMLMQYPNNLLAHLNDKPIKIFNDYNFRPVWLKKQNTLADYIENKHLYFIKIANGTKTKVW